VGRVRSHQDEEETSVKLNVLTIAVATLCATAGPVYAQGALKPVEALIVNPASRPVPVSVVPSAAPASVVCRIDFGGGNPLPVTHTGTSFPIGDLNCPAGVSRLDVQRVVASTGRISSPEAPVHFVMEIGLGHQEGNGYAIDTPIATLSSGTPDLSLAHPVRIDKSVAATLLGQQICSSGLPTVAVRCLGTVFLIGTPVN
jgi:hypothetical protein